MAFVQHLSLQEDSEIIQEAFRVFKTQSKSTGRELNTSIGNLFGTFQEAFGNLSQKQSKITHGQWVLYHFFFNWKVGLQLDHNSETAL